MMMLLYTANLEQSGYATSLREQHTRNPVYDYQELTGLKIDIPEVISIVTWEKPATWQFLYLIDEGRYDWLDSALAKTAEISTGSDRAYADLALHQASHVSQSEPRVYSAPEGGVVIENRTASGMLTLLIEGRIGLIVRSADEFHVRAEFNITQSSINELLVRYLGELRLLFVSREN
jgi:hypothetical protein